MLAEIRKDALIHALQHVSKAVPLNSPVPILQGIHIQASERGVVLTAGNSSLTVQSAIPQNGEEATVHRAGALVVPSRYFMDVIRRVGDDRLVIEQDDNDTLTVTSGSSRIRLCGMDAGEFPCSIHNGWEQVTDRLHIRNAVLKSSLKQAAQMAARSETRPVLTGIFLEEEDDSLRLTATDGVRLACQSIHTGRTGRQSIWLRSAILPARNAYEVSRMLSVEDGLTELAWSQNRVLFHTENIKVESVLIEGSYPSIKNVVPQTFACEIVLNRASLLAAVECVEVLANERVVRFEIAPGRLKLLSRTAEVGDIESEVPLLHKSGEDFRAALNGKYVTDVLKHLECTDIGIKYAGPDRPVVLVPADPAALSAFFLIPPVRVHA